METNEWMLWGVGLGLVAVFILSVFVTLSIRIQRLTDTLNKVKRDGVALTRGAVGVGNRLHKTCDELQALKQKCRVLENQKGLPSYDQAVELVALGASTEDLMTHCGFPKGEAELLISLSKKKQPAPSNVRSFG